MTNVHETVLEIDLQALTQNYEFMRNQISSETKLMAVVKAFGYGSDAPEVAKHLEGLGVDYFAVAYSYEGIALRDAGVKTPIMVLHPLPMHFEEIIDRCLEPSLYNCKTLDAFIEAAEKKGQGQYPIHVKFNTGLNRLGFWENDVHLIAEKLEKTSTVKVVSLLSHLAASEDPKEMEFSSRQIDTFKKIAKEFHQKMGYKPMLHMCNTSGILNFPEAHFDMVRSGIGLYGFGNDPRFRGQLKPIASLKTVISQLHKVEPGESVGYNRGYTADDRETIATLPIGHADGISRIYGNGKGSVFIHGQKAAIVGNVCMDMIMIDVTGIDCKEGDEVLVFGQENSAETFASSAQTISYEILTAISQRVKRVVK